MIPQGGTGGAAGGVDAGEEVFAEVVVVVGAGRVGGEHDDVACLVAEFVEHRLITPSASALRGGGELAPFQSPCGGAEPATMSRLGEDGSSLGCGPG